MINTIAIALFSLACLGLLYVAARMDSWLQHGVILLALICGSSALALTVKEMLA